MKLTFIISILALRFCVTSAARFQLSTPATASPPAVVVVLVAAALAAAAAVLAPPVTAMVAEARRLGGAPTRDVGRGKGSLAGEFAPGAAVDRGIPAGRGGLSAFSRTSSSPACRAWFSLPSGGGGLAGMVRLRVGRVKEEIAAGVKLLGVSAGKAWAVVVWGVSIGRRAR